MNSLRRHKYAILLTALLGVTLVESFSQRLLRPLLSDVVMMTMMVLVFLIVFERRSDRLVACIALIIAAGASAAHSVLSGSYPQLPFRVFNHGAKLLLMGFATLVILRNIFAQRVVRADDVLGAVCGYLLAAGACADVYLLLESFLPGSFRVSPGFIGGLDTWDGRIAVLTNVSLGSLTSIGSSAAAERRGGRQRPPGLAVPADDASAFVRVRRQAEVRPVHPDTSRRNPTPCGHQVGA